MELSPWLKLDCFYVLIQKIAAVEPFKREYVSENVLRRLMVQNIFIHIKADELTDDSRKFIYRAGKPTDYFALLLEGRARVTFYTSANEELVHEAGPFSCFGVPAIFVAPGAGLSYGK